MAHTYYPVALDLAGRRCLVVGGGNLATEKVEGLLQAGAQVTVISPSATPTLLALAESGAIALARRRHRRDDLTGVYLAYGADADRAINARVAEHARQAGVLVNAVDDIPNCDFFAVALVKRGDLQIAISTNGRSPAFAHWMREYLEECVPSEHADLLDLLGDVRRELKARGTIPPYQHWHAAISDDVLLRLRHGDVEGARRRLSATLFEAQEVERNGVTGSALQWGT